jgi:hypothetical protein
MRCHGRIIERVMVMEMEMGLNIDSYIAIYVRHVSRDGEPDPNPYPYKD